MEEITNIIISGVQNVLENLFNQRNRLALSIYYNMYLLRYKYIECRYLIRYTNDGYPNKQELYRTIVYNALTLFSRGFKSHIPAVCGIDNEVRDEKKSLAK